MKGRVFGWLLTVTLIGMCGGCIESSTLVKINKDGSGSITVQEYLSPEVSGMMGGMGNMMGEMANAMATNMDATAEEKAQPEKKPVEMAEMFKEGARAKAAEFGEGVTMTSYMPLTNAAGWKGYQATYAFKDANQLTVALGNMQSGGEGEGGRAKGEGSTAYRLKFTPGATAGLTISEVKKEKKADNAAAADKGKAKATISMGGGEGMDDMGAGMMQMMAPMLKGMRLSMLVQVDGKITETNAKFRSSANPNVVVVMDVPMDKLLANADAMKLMSSNKPEDKAKVAKMQIPGVRMEDPDKAITIKFQ